jgi:acid phosphatase type 7
MPKGKAANDKSEKKSHKHKHHKRDHKDKVAKKGHKKDHSAKQQKKHGSTEAPTDAASKKADKKGAKQGAQPPDPTRCAEHGVWTDVTQVRHPPANQPPLPFSSVDPEENQRILSSGKMSFAMVGCSGDPTTGANTQAVAAAISADQDLSFFYHLGDIIYTISGSDTEGGEPIKPYSHSLWDNQLFGPYAKFPKKIFAIAGNHDGKYKEKILALRDYFRFFCADTVEPPTGAKHRRQMTQPYIYWRLDTPYAYIIGLYSNIANSGILDKPSEYTTANFTDGPQYKWLVEQLQAIAMMNKTAGEQRRAVLLTVHYPPYSGATNFNVRGDPSKGGPAAKGKHPAQPNNYDVPCLAAALQRAFKDSGQRPDAMFSAHAHLFQRLNYKFADGTVMPCLIVGCGGHSPLEKLFHACDGTSQKASKPPFDAVKPEPFQFPKGDQAKVKYYDDREQGGISAI